MSDLLEYSGEAIDPKHQEILWILYRETPLPSESEEQPLQAGLEGGKVKNQVSFHPRTANRKLRELAELGLIERHSAPQKKGFDKKYNNLTIGGREFVEANTEVVQAPSDVAALRAEFADLKQQVEEMRGMVEELMEIKKTLEGEESRVGSLMYDLEAQIGSFERIQEQREGLEETLVELDTKQGAVEDKIEDGVNQIEDAADDQAQQAKESIQQEVTKAEQAAKGVVEERETIEGIRDEINEQMGDAGELREDVDELQKKLKHVDGDNLQQVVNNLHEVQLDDEGNTLGTLVRVYSEMHKALRRQGVFVTPHNARYQELLKPASEPDDLEKAEFKPEDPLPLARRKELNDRLNKLEQTLGLDKVDNEKFDGTTLAEQVVANSGVF